MYINNVVLLRNFIVKSKKEEIKRYMDFKTGGVQSRGWAYCLGSPKRSHDLLGSDQHPTRYRCRTPPVGLNECSLSRCSLLIEVCSCHHVIYTFYIAKRAVLSREC